MNPVSENIFQAIDQLVDAKLNTIAFDKTDLCEVLLVYEDIPNTYRVSNGSMKFDAIGQPDTKYSKGQNVYVLIPKGDYTANKIIIGEYSAEEEKRYQYISPLDRLIVGWRRGWKAKTPNEYLTISVTSGKAESPTESGQGQITLDENEIISLNGFGQYTYIGFEFGLGCQFEYPQGNYSIKVEFMDVNNNILSTILILSSEIQGNPYSLSYQMPISYIIDTSSIKDINKIKYITFNLTQNDDFAEGDIGKTITLTSFHIKFGYEKEKLLSEFNDGTLKVVLDTPFTPDNREEDYVYNSDSDSKSMSLDWLLNKVLYNEHRVNTQNYKIYWCRYLQGYEKTAPNDIKESGIWWETVQALPASNPQAYSYTLTSPRIKYSTDKIKVLIRNEDKPTEFYEIFNKEPIIFSNQNRAKDSSVQTSQEDLKLITSPGSHYVYSSSGKKLSSYEEYTVEYQFLDNIKPSETDKVIWRIPAKDTMLQPININSENTDWQLSEDGGFYTNTIANMLSIKYAIAEQYFPGKNNNQIECTVISGRTQEEYYGSLNINFGYKSNKGTAYTLNIVPNHYAPLPYCSEKNTPNKIPKTVICRAMLLNAEGEEIDLSELKNAKMEWSWIASNYWSKREGETVNPYILTTQPDNSCVIYRHDDLVKRSQETDADFTVRKMDPNNICTVGPAYSLLQVKVTGFSNKAEGFSGASLQPITLVAYYPICWGGTWHDDKMPDERMIGPTQIMYDFFGNPQFDEQAYELINTPPDYENHLNQRWYIKTEAWVSHKAEGTVPSQGPWDNGWGSADRTYELNAPNITKSIEKNIERFNLIPPNEYPEALQYNSYIIFESQDPKNDIEPKGRWYCPLLVTKDYYQHNYLNAWDGSTSIVNENSILSQTIGAGKKIKTSDGDYKFSGVLMGNVADANATAKYGLYGFKSGKKMFSFDEEGNGYLAGEITATGNSKFGNSGYQLYIGTVNNGQNLALLMGNETNNLEFWLSASNNNMISYTNSLKFAPQSTDVSAITFGTAGLITINNSLMVQGTATFESYITCEQEATFQHDLIMASDYSLYNPGKYVFGVDWDLRDGVMGINSDSSIYINAIKSGQLQGTWTLNGASISTSSDQNAKYDILDLSNKYESLFDALQPRLYKFKNGTSNRFHTGFIAQEVNDALLDAGLDTMDFAAVVIENPETEEERWGLRYEEFISLNTWQIQKLKSQVTELEDLLREKGVI